MRSVGLLLTYTHTTAAANVHSRLRGLLHAYFDTVCPSQTLLYELSLAKSGVPSRDYAVSPVPWILPLQLQNALWALSACEHISIALCVQGGREPEGGGDE